MNEVEAKQLLSDQWNEIVVRVIKPLWLKKFKHKYAFIKMDYKDFESMAGYEITKAMPSYNSQKKDLFGFAYTIVVNKANTEIRDANRDTRRINVDAISLNTPMGDDSNEELGDLIETEVYEDNSDVKKIKKYMKSLSWIQKEILFLKSIGMDKCEIMDIMDIDSGDYDDNIRKIQSHRKTSKLRNGVN